MADKTGNPGNTVMSSLRYIRVPELHSKAHCLVEFQLALLEWRTVEFEFLPPSIHQCERGLDRPSRADSNLSTNPQSPQFC